MIRSIILLAFTILFSTSQASAQKIKVYFNHPVNTTVSTGVNAIYLNQQFDDTIKAYIDRAKYTLDIAVYNFGLGTTMANIAGAVNNAYNRGVVIRWIYNTSSSNNSLPDLDVNIPRIGSPTGINYGIMHNKFMVIDGNSADINDPIVLTGSTNWTDQQINSDYNNIVIVQDKNLALAYITEFNEMWGSATPTPNLTLSKFGQYKTDNTPHQFTIDGKSVELYFSPSDNTTQKLISKINAANSSIYFGIYAFTDTDVSDALTNKIQNDGLYVAGIMDQFSVNYTPYPNLTPVMGNNLKIFNLPYIYHNKMMLIDACDVNSDPMIFSGSHNWSGSADTKNDENVLIIHDDTIANLYYQAIYSDFQVLSLTISSCSQVTGVEVPILGQSAFYPNPATDYITFTLEEKDKAEIKIFDQTGRIVKQQLGISGNNTMDLSELSPGIYFVTTNKNGNTKAIKLIVQ
jgi:PLD-like domain/Secretion system C-terminal sorting domain